MLTDNPVGIGQHVFVRGNVGRSSRDNLVYPYLFSVDIHIVLFFPTETHLLVVMFVIAITGVVSTSIYLYRKNNSK